MKNEAFNADELLAAAGNLKTEFISAESLGFKKGVWVRELNGKERELIMKQGGVIRMLPGDVQELDLSSMKAGTMAQIACWALVTDATADKQMFRPNEVGKLQRLGSRFLDVVSKRVRTLSGMDSDSLEAKKKSLNGSQSNGDGLS